MILALFDFDGTISTKDSTMDFVAKTFGKKKAKKGARRLIFQIPLFYLRLMTLRQIKESYLKYFFKGKEYDDLKMQIKSYTKKTFPQIILSSAVDRIKWHKDQGHEVAVVSGSHDIFLEDFCDEHRINLITNSFEVIEGKVTGRINEEYCFGPGKVKLIKEQYDLGTAEYIYAYGNSRGDKEMLELADESFYQYFE